MLLAFARRLHVSAGRRTRTALEKAAGVLGRPRAFLRAAMTRAAADKEAARTRGSFAVGDAVLARGQPGTLMGIAADGSCTIEFKAGSAYEEVTYASMRGRPRSAPAPGAAGPILPSRVNTAGSAQLQHPPLTLEPDARAATSRCTSSATEVLIYEHYLEKLARSPHQRDSMTRRVARHVWDKEQALILTETYDNLYASFNEKYPGIIGRSKFIDLKPWFIKRAYRETCLCRSCENLSLYTAMLHDVSAELRPLLDAALLAAEMSGEVAAAEPPSAEVAATAPAATAATAAAAAAATTATTATATAATADDDDDDDNNDEDADDDADATAEAAADAAATVAEDEADAHAEATGLRELQALLNLCASPHKSALLNQLVCGGIVAAAKPGCRDGECRSCGMASIWSRGMRPKVIDKDGRFRADAPAVWKTVLGWERYKAPPKTTAAPTDEGGGHQHSEHGGKESMRQPRSGSIVAALDEFENFVAKKAVQHRARQISTAEAARWCAKLPHPSCPIPVPSPLTPY
jgi:hypothetical protein